MNQQYTIDQNGDKILLRNNTEQVMMEWEKSLMESCIDELEIKGDVLEIGFGLGYSATQIQKYKPKSHTIIEMDPMVIEKCKEWAEDYDNVIIVEGMWQNKLKTLGKFDRIFFDDHPVQEIMSYRHMILEDSRVKRFYFDCSISHSKVGTKIGQPLYDTSTYFNKLASTPFYSHKEIEHKTTPPKHCKYNQNNKNIVSIMTIDKILTMKDIFI